MKCKWAIFFLSLFGLFFETTGAQSIVSTTAIAASSSKLWLPGIFGNNMVLQKGRKNPLWGKAGPGEQLLISFAGKNYPVSADRNGSWRIRLASMDYGGPYTLRIRGSQTIEFTNVMIGEVWLCSGQSNMGFPLEGSDNSEKEIQAADFPMIRLFNVGSRLAQHPQADVETGQWRLCSPGTVRKFSAVAYFFGRELYRKLNVAIGLIHSSVGGTYIENWISGRTLAKDTDFADRLTKLLSINQSRDSAYKIAEIKRITGAFLLKDEGMVNGKAIYADPDLDVHSWIDLTTPAPWNPLFGGIGWCRKEFFLTDEEAGRPVEIHLSRIDDDDNTYLNGTEIGNTQNVGDRIYKVGPAVLKAGRNVLVSRIRNRGGTGGMLGQADEMYAATVSRKISLAGVWKFKLSEVSPYVLSFQKNDYPTILYNGMIAPLIPFGIRGTLWYQGEANTGRAEQYRRIFPALISDWREQWQQGDFPFIFVSIANFQKPASIPGQSSWAALREAQACALSLPNTGMAVTIDLDPDGNLHPTNKCDVGIRSALSALKIAYHQKNIYTSPVYAFMKLKGRRVQLSFKQVGSGLRVSGGSIIHGFAVAGEDKIFHWADARLVSSNTVEIVSDEVSNPVAVRYAWSDNPGEVNLYNKEGLPVNSFRTDNW